MYREVEFGLGIGKPFMSMPDMLRRTIAQLINDGWTKDDFYDGQGGSCILGAEIEALRGYRVMTDDFNHAQALLIQTLKDMHPELTAESIPELNDDPAVTFQDVIAALEKTVLQLEERG